MTVLEAASAQGETAAPRQVLVIFVVALEGSHELGAQGCFA